MDSQTIEPLEIRVVPADKRAEALWRVFDWEAELLRRERIAASVELSRTEPAAFQHLLEARRGETCVAAAWGHIVPGRIANVWPACVSSNESPAADALQIALDGRLAQADVVCGQSLLPTFATSGAECLVRNGYSLAARLLFMACQQQTFPAQEPSGDLEFEPYRLDQSSRLAQLIDRTYVGSLDAPALNGIRATEDVIDGYRLTGTFSPERWFFVRHQDCDVGCLLLADHPGVNQWELVYMGLVPSARGRGWGVKITRYAQWRASQARRGGIWVGVDESNDRAVATYDRCGFHEVDRRLVLLKKF